MVGRGADVLGQAQGMYGQGTGLVGQGTGMYGQGAAMTGRAADMYAPGAAQQFYNPYEQDVVQQTMRDLQEANQQRGIADRAGAIGQGAFGGSRGQVNGTGKGKILRPWRRMKLSAVCVRQDIVAHNKWPKVPVEDSVRLADN